MVNKPHSAVSPDKILLQLNETLMSFSTKTNDYKDLTSVSLSLERGNIDMDTVVSYETLNKSALCIRDLELNLEKMLGRSALKLF